MDPLEFTVEECTLMQVGQPLTKEAFEYICALMVEMEAIRALVGGDGHDNMGDRVQWALKAAKGERPH